jgi:acyl-CoA thioesterase I
MKSVCISIASIIFSFTTNIVAEQTTAPTLPKELLQELEKKWPRNRAINIVFHGHSVPAGYHKTPEVKPFESYPHLFHKELKNQYPHAVINVIVTAIGGENSIQGETRFKSDVLIHKPDLIFIDYALNDRRQDPAKVEAAWHSMVKMAKEQNIPVILITPTGDSSAKLNDPNDPLCQRAELIRQVAEKENVLLADVFSAWQAEVASGTPQTELLSQINHPNLRGHQLAQSVITQLFKK